MNLDSPRLTIVLIVVLLILVAFFVSNVNIDFEIIVLSIALTYLMITFWLITGVIGGKS